MGGVDVGRARMRTGVLLLPSLAAAALVLAGCSSSGGGYGASGTQTSSTAASPGSSATPGAAAAGEVISTTSGSLGPYLTDGTGRAVYLWMGDTSGKSNCTGSCATIWPPVITNGPPQAGSGATAADLGEIARSDGSEQVTYNGHPLYYFASDSGTTQYNGEGKDGFGALWWLVSPAGSPVTTGSSASSSTSSSTGKALGGY